jgi:hypothetical protein
MTKKTFFYIVMFFISLIIMIAGIIMCVYANSLWETQMNQIITTTLTTGLESLETVPVWMSSIRIWGTFCLLVGAIGFIVFGTVASCKLDE